MKMKFILPFFILFQVLSVKSQTPSDTSLYHYWVSLTDDFDDDDRDDYLDEFNSELVWHHEPTGLALWKVISYPFTTLDGIVINDIQSVIRESVKKTKITQSDFDFSFNIDNNSTNSGTTCFNPIDFSIIQGTLKNVKLGILDTGFSTEVNMASDSIHNYNLTSYSSFNVLENNSDILDDNGHGSNITGLVYSITHGISTSGGQISYFLYKTHDSLGRGIMSNVIFGLLNAIDDDCDIINMSFGVSDILTSETYFPFRKSLQYANEQNVLIINAAGNNGKNIDNLDNTFIPAALNYPTCISVGSLNCDNSLASYSNFGPSYCDLATLGTNITCPSLDGNQIEQSGTSFSAAIISGMAALIATYKSTFDAALLKCAIQNSVQSLPLTDDNFLHGVLPNINQAIQIYQNPIASYNVTNTNSSGSGSFMAAIKENCGVNNITFDQTTNLNEIPINKNIYIDKDLHIIGNGPVNTILNLQDEKYVTIGPNGNLELQNLKIKKSSPSSSTLINKGDLIISTNVIIK